MEEEGRKWWDKYIRTLKQIGGKNLFYNNLKG